MTNWEKFKEVFNVPDLIEPVGDICDVLSCDRDIHCWDCIFFGYGEFWSKEYKENK